MAISAPSGGKRRWEKERMKPPIIRGTIIQETRAVERGPTNEKLLNTNQVRGVVQKRMTHDSKKSWKNAFLGSETWVRI